MQQYITNEFNNSNLNRTSFKQAKPMLIATAVVFGGIVAAFCHYY